MDNYFVGEFEVDSDRCQIKSNGNVYSVESKMLQVLTLLAEHQGDVVYQETLLSEVWSGTVVDPNALQRCIAQLRKAFGDDAKRQYAIATYPKKGYSLLLKVKPVRKRNLSRALIYGLSASVAGIISIGLFYSISMLQVSDKPGFFRSQKDHRLSVIPLNLNPEQNVFLAYSADDHYLISPLQLEDANNQFIVKNLVTNIEEQIEITSLDTNSVFEWIRSSEFLKN